SKINNVVLLKAHTNKIIPGFYDINLETRKTLDTKLMELRVPNQYQSYGQWINFLNMGFDYDYYILMEDDYVPASYDFVDKLIEQHQKKLPGGGLLCSYTSNIAEWYPQHAAVSNSIVDGKTFKEVTKIYKDPLQAASKLVSKAG